MKKEYRIYYDLGLREYCLCGNQRKQQEDEIPVIVTKSLEIAEVMMKKLNEDKGELK